MDVPPSDGQRSTPVNIPKGDDEKKEKSKKEKLQKKFQEYLIRTLQNSEGTKGIHKKLVMKYDGGYQNVEINYTPAAGIRVPVPETDELADPMAEEIDIDPFENTYAGMFCPSMERGEARHAVNLPFVVKGASF